MQQTIEALGWALIHFTWQGALIGVGLAMAMHAMTRSTASSRYAVSVGALLALALCPIITFLFIYQPMLPAAALVTTSGASSVIADGFGDSGSIWSVFVNEFRNVLPVIVALWLAGVVVFGGRLVRDWMHVRRLLTHGIQPLPVEWQLIVHRLSASLGVRQAVRVFESTLVTVPMVIGWLKPVVLIPPSAFMGLTPKQLELILAHELAHVRRFDYLVNLIQLFIETLLFYHPAVRWVSTRIREERENCCDDMVVTHTGERIVYAQALTEMAELHNLTPRVTVAASGGALFKRIHRLISLPSPQQGSVHWVVGLVLVATSMTLVATGQLQLNTDGIDTDIEAVEDGAGDLTGTLEAQIVAIPVPVTVATVSGTQKSDDAPVSDTPVAALPAPEQGGVEQGAIEQEAVESKPPMAQEVSAVIEAMDRVETNTSSVAEPVVEAQPEIALTTPLATSATEASTTEASPSEASIIAPEQHAQTGGRLISGSQPDFPRKAMVRGVQGWVTIRYTVGTDGKVKDFVVLEAEPRRVFEKSVRRAVRSWTFEPFLTDGQPVAKTVEQTIEFALDSTQRSAGRPGGCDFATGSRLCRDKKESRQLGMDVIKQAALGGENSQ